MTGQELAKRAYEALDASGNIDFARKLGLEGDYRDKRVARWLSGANEPDFDGTLRMLAAVGLLREDVDGATPRRAALPPAELEAKVDGGFEKTTKALEKIAARLATLEGQLAAPPKTARRR